MKKLQLSIIALLLTCSLFAISPAKADPGLAIDTHAWVWVATVGVIGIGVAVRKSRKENQPVPALQPVSK